MNRPIRDVYLEWMQLMNRGAFEEALATAQQMLELADQEADKRWRANLEGCLKTTTASLERMKALKQQFETTYGTDDNSADWWVERGLCFMEGCAWLEAADAFTHAVSLAPQNAEAWHCLGVVSSELVESFYSLDQVLEFFDQALTLNPNAADTWYYKGLALTQALRSQEALQCYNHILTHLNGAHAGALAMKRFELSR